MLDVDIVCRAPVLAKDADDRLEALKLIVRSASGCVHGPAFAPEIGAILDQTVAVTQTRSFPIISLAVAILTASW